MKIKQKVVLLLILSSLVYQNANSQSKTQSKPVPVIIFNDNVNEPLTMKELAQIKEVYGEKAGADILSKPQRVKDIKNILRNRVIFKEAKPGKTNRQFPSLSSVSLFDTYVSNLTRDVVFNPNTFNPLKYNFNFYSRNSYIYKIDNTDYYIIIKSQEH